MANKIKYGLKSVHTASITIGTGGAVTFGTPVALPGAKSITIDPKGETSEFYADDEIYYTGSSNDGYDGTLEMAELTEDFVKNYLGATTDSNGNLIERSTDKAVPFALLYEFAGDESATRHILYYCKATRPTDESSTTEGSIEPGTVSLPFVAAPLPGASHVIKGKAANSTSSSTYNTWFSAAPTVPTF